MPILSEIGYPNQLIELPDFVKAQKRFGSFYVPKNSAAKNYLFPLKEFIENCSNPIQKFNCQSAFTALLLMYLTGMRAVEVGRLDLNSFYQTDKEDIVFIVDGKSNRYFDEYRIAYLDAAYSLIIKKYQENTQKILDQIYNEFAVFPSVAAQERNNKLFFFLTENGEILEFTSAEFNRKLKNDFPLYGNIPVYKFRINAPRQFFATAAADLGISRRLIDSLMGHTSRGREPLFRFSDLAFEEIKSASREVSGKIADLLDFNKLLNQ